MISFIKKILEEVLENIFLTHNYAFRIHENIFGLFENVHTWTNVAWCIKGQITKFFTQIDFFLLGQFLFNNIKDILILNLFFRFIGAGYFSITSNLLFCCYLGKDSSLIYLLVNIYLHHFDKFIDSLKKKTQIFFVRFGFLWLLGCSGSYHSVILLRKKIIFYFIKYLHLVHLIRDIKIFNLMHTSFFFKGVEIKKIFSLSSSLLLYCPIKLLLYNFKKLGFFKRYKNKVIPCAQRKWLSLDITEIFWKYYLLKNRLFKFYFFVDNFQSLLRLYSFLKLSLIYTLGRKLQLSKKKIIQKFKYSLKMWII